MELVKIFEKDFFTFDDVKNYIMSVIDLVINDEQFEEVANDCRESINMQHIEDTIFNIQQCSEIFNNITSDIQNSEDGVFELGIAEFNNNAIDVLVEINSNNAFNKENFVESNFLEDYVIAIGNDWVLKAKTLWYERNSFETFIKGIKEYYDTYHR